VRRLHIRLNLPNLSLSNSSPFNRSPSNFTLLSFNLLNNRYTLNKTLRRPSTMATRQGIEKGEGRTFDEVITS
jgi:hypothetical protein